jgi:hypothetical protein
MNPSTIDVPFWELIGSAAGALITITSIVTTVRIAARTAHAKMAAHERLDDERFKAVSDGIAAIATTMTDVRIYMAKLEGRFERAERNTP